MAHYIYHGPVQSIELSAGTIKGKDGEKRSKFRELELRPGRETGDLPADNPIVAAMVERKLLRPIPAKPTPKSKAEGA